MDGNGLAGVYLQNVTFTTERLAKGLDLSLSIANVFGARYEDPGAEEHVQRGIPQEGRTVRAGLTVRF